MKSPWMPLALLASVALAGALSVVATGTFAGAKGRIAFTMRDESGSFDVYTMKPDGTGIIRVTSDPATDRNPHVVETGGDSEPNGVRLERAVTVVTGRR